MDFQLALFRIFPRPRTSFLELAGFQGFQDYRQDFRACRAVEFLTVDSQPAVYLDSRLVDCLMVDSPRVACQDFQQAFRDFLTAVFQPVVFQFFQRQRTSFLELVGFRALVQGCPDYQRVSQACQTPVHRRLQIL